MLFVSDVPVSIACAVPICLFTLQHYGSHKIGFIFAPIVFIWLLFITGLGLYNIFYYEQIIYAISPVYMNKFMKTVDIRSWRLLGSILLSVAGWLVYNELHLAWFTFLVIYYLADISEIAFFPILFLWQCTFAGSEAMFVDLGHFSRRSIKVCIKL